MRSKLPALLPAVPILAAFAVPLALGGPIDHAFAIAVACGGFLVIGYALFEVMVGGSRLPAFASALVAGLGLLLVAYEMQAALRSAWSVARYLVGVGMIVGGLASYVRQRRRSGSPA